MLVIGNGSMIQAVNMIFGQFAINFFITTTNLEAAFNRCILIILYYSILIFLFVLQIGQNGTSGANGNNCGCPKGFRKSGYRGECVDVNECLDSPCVSNLNCINTPGGYQCICANGQIYDPQYGASQGCNGRTALSQVCYYHGIYNILLYTVVIIKAG